MLWTLLYESTARAEEVLLLNVAELNTANRRAVVTRKGGARDVIVWQTGTARLLPRLLAGRKTGPVFLTDRKARPSVALVDVDPAPAGPGWCTGGPRRGSNATPPTCRVGRTRRTSCATPA